MKKLTRQSFFSTQWLGIFCIACVGTLLWVKPYVSDLKKVDGTIQNSSFTFSQDLQNSREYWTGARASAYDNFPDEIPAEQPIAGQSIFDHLTSGRAILTDIFIASTGPTPVPEPTSMLLFGTGLIGLARAIMRKMKK